jgi:ankyrin repeat protein
LDNKEKSLLHLAVADDGNDAAIVIAKVQYLCEQCPALTKLKDHKGYTPLQKLLKMSKYHDVRFNFEIVQYLLCLDGTAVKEMCAPPDTTRADNGQLPLHLICQEEWSVLMTEVSEKGDCFRLLLRLYPAAASIKDGQGNTPYDIAVSSNLSTYFLRLLLAVDPSLDPIQRHDLNFAARREGMFLAFMALSSNYEPSIWANLRYEDKHLLQHVISYL